MGFSTSVMPSVILSRETFIKVHHGRDFWLGQRRVFRLDFDSRGSLQASNYIPGTTNGLFGTVFL